MSTTPLDSESLSVIHKVNNKNIANKSKNGKKRKYNLRKIATTLAAVAFALYFVYSIGWQQFSISKKKDEIQALQTQIETAKQETVKLQSELDSVNDPEYLERMAREKLGLVQANERVFIDANKGK
ncbi:MAG: septum formation initiator family protein [Oscillospiraceae bacterium]